MVPDTVGTEGVLGGAGAGAGQGVSWEDWFRKNRLSMVGGLWATGISVSLAYNWTRPHIPVQLKIIHRFCSLLSSPPARMPGRSLAPSLRGPLRSALRRSRVYAQALTVGALGAAALVEKTCV